MEKIKTAFQTVFDTLDTLPASQSKTDALKALSDLTEIAHELQTAADKRTVADATPFKPFDKNNP
jgi:hypothetical protein